MNNITDKSVVVMVSNYLENEDDWTMIMINGNHNEVNNIDTTAMISNGLEWVWKISIEWLACVSNHIGPPCLLHVIWEYVRIRQH